MIHLTHPTGHWLTRGLAVVLLAIVMAGCGTTGEATEGEDENGSLEISDVTGQWTYTGSQRSPFHRGRFSLRSQGNYMTGTMQDERIGGYAIRAEIRGNRLVMRVQFPTSEVQITGRVTEDRFRGQVSLSDIDLTRSTARQRTRSSNLGSFTAERREDPGPEIEEPAIADCPRITPVGRIPCS